MLEGWDRALSGSPGTHFKLEAIDIARRNHLQQLSAERQQGLAATVGKEAEEAAAHKAMRKHMQKEAAQELVGCYRHELLFAAIGVILPAERHLSISEVYEPMIRDGHTMGVTSQVMKDVLRAAEWRLGVRPSLGGIGTEERNERSARAQAREDFLERSTAFF